MNGMNTDQSLWRLVVVDDHDEARRLIASSLDAEADIDVVATAATAAEAVRVIARLQPDIALVDANLGDASGRAVMEQVRELSPTVRCIIHTGSLSAGEADALVQAGAEAVVLKSIRGTDLLNTIRVVASRDRPIR